MQEGYGGLQKDWGFQNTLYSFYITYALHFYFIFQFLSKRFKEIQTPIILKI